MKKLLKTVRFMAKKLGGDEVTVYAAQASFYLIISSVPFVMLFLAVSQFFLPISQADARNLMQTFLPVWMHRFGETVIAEIFSKAPASLVSVTAITTLWTASRGVSAIGKGLGRIYGISEKRSFFADVMHAVLYTLILIFVLLFALAVLIFGNRLLQLFSGSINGVARLAVALRYPVYLFMLVLFFAGLYQGFTHRKMRFAEQFPGAVLTAFGWSAFSWGFSVYIDFFANYSYIYGSLATIVLLMLWLYACAVILLFGAEWNLWIKSKVLFGKE